MLNPGSKLTRIGVILRWQLLFHVSNHYYYHFNRPRLARLRVSGLREFGRDQVVKGEGFA